MSWRYILSSFHGISLLLASEGSNLCTSYGCPFLPRDVYFDDETRDNLSLLRRSVIDLLDGQNETYYKALATLQSSGTEDMATLTLTGYKGGHINNQINQDRAVIYSPFLNENDYAHPSLPTQLLAVFDGHATKGEIVSQYASDELPKLLSSKLYEIMADDLNINDESIHSMFTSAFHHINSTIPSHQHGGCTASVVLRLGDKIHIANVGDSRVFIVAYSPFLQSVRFVYATREDKPHLPEERARVESTGGLVYIPNEETSSSRVVLLDRFRRMKMSLAMSRSLGDWDFSGVGVIATPIVTSLDMRGIGIRNETGVEKKEECQNSSSNGETSKAKICSSLGDKELERDAADELFAVAATDGLLDYIQPLELAMVMAKALYDIPKTKKDAKRMKSPAEEDIVPKIYTIHPLLACERMIMNAAQAWYDDMGYKYRDDIALAVMKIPR